jgi:hypothetical protein
MAAKEMAGGRSSCHEEAQETQEPETEAPDFMAAKGRKERIDPDKDGDSDFCPLKTGQIRERKTKGGINF